MSRMIACRIHAAFFVSLGLLAAAGCDDPPRQTVDAYPATATAPAEAATPTIAVAALTINEPTPAFPGFATGRIMDQHGKPIGLPGARLEVIITGLLDEDQQRVTLPVEPDRNGVYIVRLKPGTYLQSSGRIEFSFAGNQYRLPLSPHGPSPRRQESTDGVVQDFVWKLEGPRPGMSADKNRPDTYLGGTITPEYLSYRPDLKRTIKSPPVGTKVQFTLAPRTPLANGEPGMPRVVVRQYNPTQTGLVDAPIIDLPLATWEIRAEEIFPDGSRSPLLLRRNDGKWHDSASGTFPADLAESSLQPVIIQFTRKE